MWLTARKNHYEWLILTYLSSCFFFTSPLHSRVYGSITSTAHVKQFRANMTWRVRRDKEKWYWFILCQKSPLYKSAHFLVNILAGRSIVVLHKLLWQISSEIQCTSGLQPNFAVLKERLRLETCKAWVVENMKRNISHLMEWYQTKQDIWSRG